MVDGSDLHFMGKTAADTTAAQKNEKTCNDFSSHNKRDPFVWKSEYIRFRVVWENIHA